MENRLQELYDKFLVPIEIAPKGILILGGKYGDVAMADRIVRLIIAKLHNEITEEEFDLIYEENERRLEATSLNIQLNMVRTATNLMVDLQSNYKVYGSFL